MSTQNREILKNLLAVWPSQTVATSRWLETQGVSRFLKQHYMRSGWIRSIGQGAVVKAQDTVDWPGGLYALQDQLKMPVHVGGKTALISWGLAHFVSLKAPDFFLFSTSRVLIPSWFREGPWSQKYILTSSHFLPSDLGITRQFMIGFNIFMSEPERAALEILYQVPRIITLSEADLIFENLGQLRPDLLQQLLENCRSYRVKRLCLFFGERHQHSWFRHLTLAHIDLGKGMLHLTPHGKYHPVYKITLPKEMVSHDPSSLF